jgi:predicted metal-dependent phosphoesterase TrpH
VLAHPPTRSGLREEGIAGKNELFPAYLVPGAVAYVRALAAHGAEAIEVIHAAGGVAVWAHPSGTSTIPTPRAATLERFAGAGLDGVECFYATHTEAQTRLLHEAAGRRGLLTTGSTDFHGPEHDTFSGFGGVRALRARAGPRADRALADPAAVSSVA